MEESAALSTGEELEGGGAVTVDDDPEEEEEVDSGTAAAGPAGTSEVVAAVGLSGMLDSWLEPPAAATAGLDTPSGRTAVPEMRKKMFPVIGLLRAWFGRPQNLPAC